MRRLSLLLVLFISSLCASVVRAQDATNAGALSSPFPTIENLSIEWHISGDDNLNGEVSLSYREKGTKKWHVAMPLRRIPADTNFAARNLGRTAAGYWGFGWSNKYAGSIFSLKPASCYEVRASLRDPDGGSVTKIIEACTRSDYGVLGTDSIIELKPGKYDTLFALSGTEEKRLVYRCTSGEAIFKHISLKNQRWVLVERLTVLNRENRGRGIDMSGAENCAVSFCRINAEYGIVAYKPGAVNCLISDNLIKGFYEWKEALFGAAAATNGEGIEFTGPGNVVCFNTVSGFRDCISFMEDEHAVDQRSIDVYNNEISAGLDDGIEADFCFGNCRIYNNRITNCYVGLSAQPSLGGPTYFIRNAMYNIVHSGFKLKRHSIGDVLLHNSLVKVGVGLGGNDTMDFAYFRNNLAFGGPADAHTGIYGTGKPFASDLIDPGKHSNLDYDAVGVYGTEYKAMIGSKKFEEVEKHGIGSLSFDSTFGNLRFPIDFKRAYEPVEMTLNKSGKLIDAGAVIPNVNENFRGKAPDIGAYEYGGSAPHYGVRNL